MICVSQVPDAIIVSNMNASAVGKIGVEVDHAYILRDWQMHCRNLTYDPRIGV